MSTRLSSRIVLAFVSLCLAIVFWYGSPTNDVNSDDRGEFKFTVYHYVLEAETPTLCAPSGTGTQTVAQDVGGTILTLKASFLFGLCGVAQQGTGRTIDGELIKFDDSNSGFVPIDTPGVKARYAALGVDNFAGFGFSGGQIHAIERPGEVSFDLGAGGAAGRTLVPESTLR